MSQANLVDMVLDRLCVDNGFVSHSGRENFVDLLGLMYFIVLAINIQTEVANKRLQAKRAFLIITVEVLKEH